MEPKWREKMTRIVHELAKWNSLECKSSQLCLDTSMTIWGFHCRNGRRTFFRWFVWDSLLMHIHHVHDTSNWWMGKEMNWTYIGYQAFTFLERHHHRWNIDGCAQIEFELNSCFCDYFRLFQFNRRSIAQHKCLTYMQNIAYRNFN